MSLCKDDLRDTEVPFVCTPKFQACLREALVKQPRSKRERIISFLESGGDLFVSHRIAVSSIGVSLSIVLVFVGAVTFRGGNSITPQVQAQDVVKEMELASVNLNDQQRKFLESQTQMDFEELIEQAKTAPDTLVFDLDPRMPMHIVDTREKHVSHLVTFSQDGNGHLRLKPLLPRYGSSLISTASAFHKRRILEYTHTDGDIVMLDLAENSAPRSGIVLAGN